MLLTLLAITAGLVGGYFRQGKLANIVRTDVKWLVLLVPSLVLFVATSVGIPSYSLNLTIVATFGLVVALGRNAEVRGAGIIGFGLLLNLVALVANGGVPVRSAAMATISNSSIVDAETLTDIQHLEDGDTVLAELGDIIPVPFIDVIVSFGDLIALAGLLVLVVNSTLTHTAAAKEQLSVDELLAEFGDVSAYEPDIDLRDDTIVLPNIAALPYADAVPDVDGVVLIKPTGSTVDFGQH